MLRRVYRKRHFPGDAVLLTELSDIHQLRPFEHLRCPQKKCLLVDGKQVGERQILPVRKVAHPEKCVLRSFPILHPQLPIFKGKHNVRFLRAGVRVKFVMHFMWENILYHFIFPRFVDFSPLYPRIFHLSSIPVEIQVLLF
jgi:hypothetical protein